MASGKRKLNSTILSLLAYLNEVSNVQVRKFNPSSRFLFIRHTWICVLLRQPNSSTDTEWWHLETTYFGADNLMFNLGLWTSKYIKSWTISKSLFHSLHRLWNSYFLNLIRIFMRNPHILWKSKCHLIKVFQLLCKQVIKLLLSTS